MPSPCFADTVPRDANKLGRGGGLSERVESGAVSLFGLLQSRNVAGRISFIPIILVLFYRVVLIVMPTQFIKQGSHSFGFRFIISHDKALPDVWNHSKSRRCKTYSCRNHQSMSNFRRREPALGNDTPKSPHRLSVGASSSGSQASRDCWATFPPKCVLAATQTQ